ncbi:MAG: hemolysin III family protein [Desulfobacteraceae bacterium]|nr:hemolysin III family protein [Desulfobacteraceae bacterium]MCB9494476.1 hemolysin III family protein [Desulfobacteraceae bacterium]
MEEKFCCEYSHGEEIFNSLTHGLGTLLSIAGLVVLVVYSSIYGNAWHVVSCSIFGASLIVLYLSSTLYHSFSSPKIKYFFKKMDHSAIYVLIAGTYTPFSLVMIKGTAGWILFSVVWTMAVAGIILKFTCISKISKISSAIYIAMGWICVFAMNRIIEALTTEALVYLVLGGLIYTAGVIFFAWERLKFNHGIWHLFVLAGSTFHFFAVLKGL